jgi:hypothetical protein
VQRTDRLALASIPPPPHNPPAPPGQHPPRCALLPPRPHSSPRSPAAAAAPRLAKPPSRRARPRASLLLSSGGVRARGMGRRCLLIGRARHPPARSGCHSCRLLLPGGRGHHPRDPTAAAATSSPTGVTSSSSDRSTSNCCRGPPQAPSALTGRPPPWWAPSSPAPSHLRLSVSLPPSFLVIAREHDVIVRTVGTDAAKGENPRNAVVQGGHRKMQ